MSLNIGRAVNLIEFYCRGVDPKITANHELVRQIMNMKLREFAAQTHILETSATISTVADQQEYELPADKVNVNSVVVDDYRADKIIYDQVIELQGQD